MNQRNALAFSLALIGLLLVGAGCISIGSTGTAGGVGDGGIFKTSAKGDLWSQKTAIATASGQRVSFNNASIVTVVQDPQDANALYIGTTENGLFYTYDGGESWFQPAQIGRGRVPAVAVHPKDKCVIYVAYENKVLKSEDCSRTWNSTFLDARTDKRVKVVAIDSYNPNVIWLATNSGDLLRSQDNGASWSPIYGFQDDVYQLVMSPSDSRRLFVATKSHGIWRSDDAGANWIDLSPKYKDFAGAKEFSGLAIGVSDSKLLVMASKFGLLRTKDGGDTWEKIDLLTPAGSTVIYSLAIDPKDPNNIYYGTATTFYRSANGGVNWVPKKLPTSRVATALIVDELNSSVLYLGVTRFKN